MFLELYYILNIISYRMPYYHFFWGKMARHNNNNNILSYRISAFNTSFEQVFDNVVRSDPPGDIKTGRRRIPRKSTWRFLRSPAHSLTVIIVFIFSFHFVHFYIIPRRFHPAVPSTGVWHKGSCTGDALGNLPDVRSDYR